MLLLTLLSIIVAIIALLISLLLLLLTFLGGLLNAGGTLLGAVVMALFLLLVVAGIIVHVLTLQHASSVLVSLLLLVPILRYVFILIFLILIPIVMIFSTLSAWGIIIGVLGIAFGGFIILAGAILSSPLPTPGKLSALWGIGLGLVFIFFLALLMILYWLAYELSFAAAFVFVLLSSIPLVGIAFAVIAILSWGLGWLIYLGGGILMIIIAVITILAWLVLGLFPTVVGVLLTYVELFILILMGLVSSSLAFLSQIFFALLLIPSSVVDLIILALAFIVLLFASLFGFTGKRAPAGREEESVV